MEKLCHLGRFLSIGRRSVGLLEQLNHVDFVGSQSNSLKCQNTRPRLPWENRTDWLLIVIEASYFSLLIFRYWVIFVKDPVAYVANYGFGDCQLMQLYWQSVVVGWNGVRNVWRKPLKSFRMFRGWRFSIKI